MYLKSNFLFIFFRFNGISPFFVGMAFALSFHGQEEVKSNMMTNEAIQHQKPQQDSTESVSDMQDLITKWSKMRKMRLNVLGTLTPRPVNFYYFLNYIFGNLRKTKKLSNDFDKT